jgi:hypothetical protein
MKIQFRTSRFITGVTVVCALAVATTVSAENPKAVSLEISNNQLIMKTKKDENGCKKISGESRKDGCIQVIKNKKSEISFHLIGNPECTLESGKKWKLSAVYLGGFNSRSKPTGSFGFTSKANFDKVNGDFNGVKKTSGLVTSADIKDNKITINDENEYLYNVWYKIEAICEREDGGDAHPPISYDPRIKNEGTD